MSNPLQKCWSFVERIGLTIAHDLGKADVVYHKVMPVAQFIGSIVAAADPALAPLISGIFTVSSMIEGQAVAAGTSSGTGAEKAALLMQAIGGWVEMALKARNLPADAASVQAFIDRIVNLGKTDPNLFEQLQALSNLALPAPAATPAPVAPAV